MEETLDEVLVTKLEFSTGYVLDRIVMNSTTYVSAEPLDRSKISGQFEWIQVSDAVSTRTFSHVAVRTIDSPNEGEYWFVLSEESPEVVANEKMRGDIDYLAMMMDVEL